MTYILNTSEFSSIHENKKQKIKLSNSNMPLVGNCQLKMLENKEDIEKYSLIVWNLLVKSYEDLGGLKTYRDYKDFVKKKHLIMIAVDTTETVIACATFRRIEGSFKMVSIGCNQEDDGKLALQQIIQHTILKFELHYWAEVSDAIEHYFKKYNGFPMPNIMASKILNIPESEITLSHKDDVHYDRPIGKDREVFTKMIFGIKSDEIFQEVLNAVENYYDFMNEVNKMVNESSNKYSEKQAIYIIENLYRLHEENSVNELTPNWNNALQESMKTLYSIKDKSQTVMDYIEYGEYLLSEMEVITLNPIQ